MDTKPNSRVREWIAIQTYGFAGLLYSAAGRVMDFAKKISPPDPALDVSKTLSAIPALSAVEQAAQTAAGERTLQHVDFAITQAKGFLETRDNPDVSDILDEMRATRPAVVESLNGLLEGLPVHPEADGTRAMIELAALRSHLFIKTLKERDPLQDS